MAQLDPRLAAFISRCDTLAPRLRLKRSSLSVKLFADGKRLDALATGESDIGIGRLARAERELSALEGSAPQAAAAA